MLLPEFMQQFKLLVTLYNKVSLVKIRLVNVTTVIPTLINICYCIYSSLLKLVNKNTTVHF